LSLGGKGGLETCKVWARADEDVGWAGERGGKGAEERQRDELGNRPDRWGEREEGEWGVQEVEDVGDGNNGRGKGWDLENAA